MMKAVYPFDFDCRRCQAQQMHGNRSHSPIFNLYHLFADASRVHPSSDIKFRFVMSAPIVLNPLTMQRSQMDKIQQMAPNWYPWLPCYIYTARLTTNETWTKKNDDDSVVLMCRTCRARMIFNYVDLVGAIEQDYHCPRIGWMMMNKVWNKCKNNEQIRN